MSNSSKLASKLVKILQQLSSVPKKGYNSHQNYYYMREVDVLEALKVQLIENKVILLTSSEFVNIQPKEKTDKNGNKQVEFITTVKTTHTFVDSESNETYVINSVGSGYDSTDKGAAKAITSAMKYALLKTFMISDEGADIENDGVTAQTEAKPATKTFGTPASISFGGTKTVTNGTTTPKGFTFKTGSPSNETTTVQVTSSSSAGVVGPTTTTVIDTNAPVVNSVPLVTAAPLTEKKPTFAKRQQSA